VNNLIPPRKVLGVLSNCFCVQGDQFVGRSIKELERRVRRFARVYWVFKDIKKHQIKRLFEVWKSAYIRVIWTLYSTLLLLVDDLGGGVFHQEE